VSVTKSRIQLQLEAIKSFWNEFKRVKRGVAGLIIICIFTLLAIIGPYITPYDPLYPKITEYPAGPAPIASELAQPYLHKLLPGGDALSENMRAVSDYKISSYETFQNWSKRVTGQNIEVAYTPNEGYHNDGAIKITYTSATAQPNPTSVSLTYNFKYPFKNPPGRGGFQLHISYKVDGNFTTESTVTIELFIKRIQGSEPLPNYYWRFTTIEDGTVVYIYPIYSDIPLSVNKPLNWTHKWLRSTGLWRIAPEYTALPWEKVFPTAGDYAFEVKLTFEDKAQSAKTMTVYLDNLDILIYGQVFGIFGSDGQKGTPRDMLSNLIYGARLSVFLGLSAAAISVTIGLFVGLLSGYFGGILDEVLMRITDILMCLPGLPLILVLIAVLGRSIVTLLILLSFLSWMGFAREIRSLTLSIRERAFVEAAKAAGAGGVYIVTHHILPNVISLVYLSLALSVPGVVLSEAALSWLGLYDPKVVSWGRVLSEFTNSGVASTTGFQNYWWWVILPGAMISLLTISFILLGYSLDEILNPRLRMRR